MVMSVAHADDDAEEEALRALFFQQTILSDPEGGLDFTILAPDPALDRDFPILSEQVLYDISEGRVSLAVQGPVSCFDLRENWRDISEVTLRAVDVNYNPVIDVGLSADLIYLIDEGVVTLNASQDKACFYGAAEELALFGDPGLSPGPGLSISFEPIDPENPEAQFPIYVRVGDPVSYRIIVENTGSTTIDRVGVQELYRRALSANAPAGLDHGDYQCIETGGAECADAGPETVEIETEFGPITFQVPFIRGEQVTLPPGDSIEFEVTRTVELTGGASLAEAFGSLIDLQAVVVNRDDMNMHASAAATMQIVGDGQLSATVTGDDPAVVTEQGVPSTTVAVQLLDESGNDLQEGGVEVLASIDSAFEGVVNFPASSVTASNGVAYFDVQSEVAGDYTLEFEVPVLRDDGGSASAPISLVLVADQVHGFRISPDMPEAMIEASVLPDFTVDAIDRFGNLASFDGQRINVNLIGAGGVDESLGHEYADGSTATFSGLTLPEGEVGEEFFLQARRSDVGLTGDSNPFSIIGAPEGGISALADSTPLHGQTLNQGQGTDLMIQVDSVDVAPGYELAVLVDGSGPNGVGPAGEDVCAALLVGTSCQVLLDSVGFDNAFNADTVLLNAPVTVRADAPPGSWTLNLYLALIEGQDSEGETLFSIVGQTTAEFSIYADSMAGTGQLSVTRSGVEIIAANGNNVFRQGGAVSMGLEAFDASAGADVSLAVIFDGDAPPDSGIESSAGEIICDALLTEDSCLTLTNAIGYDNTFTGNTVLIDDEMITVREDAPLGVWTLNFYLVTVDDPASGGFVDVVSTRSVEIEVTEDTATGTLIVSGDGADLDGQAYFLEQVFNLAVTVNDLDAGDYDGLAVLASAIAPDETALATIEEICNVLFYNGICPDLASSMSLSSLLTESGVVYDGEVNVDASAPLGLWQLNFRLVAIEAGVEVETIEQRTVLLTVRSDGIFKDSFNGDEN